jgi:hypothetical protein
MIISQENPLESVLEVIIARSEKLALSEFLRN